MRTGGTAPVPTWERGFHGNGSASDDESRRSNFLRWITTPIKDLSLTRPANGRPGIAVPAEPTGGELESRVEQLIVRAEQEAADSGRNIEDVLVEMGILAGSPEAPADPREEQSRLAGTLNWEVETTAKTGVQDSVSDVDLYADVVPLFLRSHSGAAPGEVRAFISRCLEPESAAHEWLDALQLFDGVRLINPRAFCEEAEYLPGFPASWGRWKAVSERLLMDEVVGYPAFRKICEEAEATGSSSIDLLAERELVPSATLTATVAAAFGIPVHDGEGTQVRRARIQLLPARILEWLELIPTDVSEGRLTVAGRRPLGPEILRHLEAASAHEVALVLVEPAVHTRLWNRVQKQLEKMKAEQAAAKPALPIVESDPIEPPEMEILTRASAVELVQKVFEDAIGEEATDIHLDPTEGGLTIRFRVDSVLYSRLFVSNERLAEEVIARIKILAELDTTERRRPQDGHVKARIGAASYDMRIATVPTYRGERMAIRIADPANAITDIGSLGMLDRELQILAGLIHRPYGMILATGPVGSGKTTTLHSCLRQLGSQTRNMMTIEDPVENELPGVNQIGVNYRIGFDFVKGLRSILRHDPDVILVGEIRDEETARIAVRASLTGLLVFSTLHAHTAAGAVTALLNFGIPPYLVGSALLGVVAQRLVRTVCPRCAESFTPSPGDWKALGGRQGRRKASLRRGTGCDHCYGTGYHGRTGVFEMLEVTSPIKELILTGGTEDQITRTAVGEGLVCLDEGGRNKVLMGSTTVEEVGRVLDV
jgi:type IV pilus assembly protein PilB